MQDAISLLLGASCVEVQEASGWKLPWAVHSYREEVQTWEKGRALVDLSDWQVIRIDGSDASDYLQRMSTADLRSLAIGQGTAAAFLTGRGTAIALVTLQKTPSGFLCLVPWGLGGRVAEHLEQFHFQEQLQVELLDGIFTIGIQTRQPLMGDMVFVPQEFPGLVCCSGTREALAEMVLALAPSHSWIGRKALELVRIRCGVPRIGADLTDKEIVLEGSVDWAIARNKGCYPGQEVVERIYTYGKVQRKLMQVEVGGPFQGSDPLELFGATDGTKAAAELRSRVELPEGDRGIGLASISRAYWDYEGVFTSALGVTAQICRS